MTYPSMPRFHAGYKFLPLKSWHAENTDFQRLAVFAICYKSKTIRHKKLKILQYVNHQRGKKLFTLGILGIRRLFINYSNTSRRKDLYKTYCNNCYLCSVCTVCLLYTHGQQLFRMYEYTMQKMLKCDIFLKKLFFNFYISMYELLSVCQNCVLFTGKV